uniref:Retrovirus-related Pol polyprotein from transposon TNT 1-94 n=1 Tax=Cannabis sativa TaxID=3483 RepID=A0A803NGT4_CANSA
MEFTKSFNGAATSLNTAQLQNPQVSLPKSYPVTFTHSLSIKLDEHNFLPWLHQVHASIKGSRLHKFLDSTQIPHKFLTRDDEQKKINCMITCDTTPQIWEALHEYYIALNAANISPYKIQLRNTKMLGSLNDYLLKIKNIVDLLATIGHKQTAQDHIEAIFNGLPPEYDVFVTSVTTRKDAYSVAEIEALLMAQSARIDKNAKNLDISKGERSPISHKTSRP